MILTELYEGKKINKVKVGIITFHYYINYGSVLQSYAMLKACEVLGYDAELINYVQTDSAIKHFFKRIIQKVKEIYYKKTIGKNYYCIKRTINKEFQKRKENFNIFFRENYKLSNHMHKKKELKRAAEKYRIVICGSDQIWNQKHSHYHLEYALNFVNYKTLKIAYAASIGRDKLPFLFKMMLKKYLRRLDAISVREDTAIKLVEEISGKAPQMVLDPTFLVPYIQWESLCSEPINKEKYIFCYFLGYRTENLQCVRDISKTLDLKIYVIPHLQLGYPENYYKFGDVVINDASPNDFLSLIKNAEYICTDSFHGTVFSILFHKKFLTFKRYKDEKGCSENHRIISLLKNVGQEQRIVSDYQINHAELLKLDIDYEAVENKLEGQRLESLKFLQKNMEEIYKKQ